MNNTDKSVTYNLIVATAKTVVTIPAHGIQTLVY
jgi:glucosylceramidase